MITWCHCYISSLCSMLLYSISRGCGTCWCFLPCSTMHSKQRQAARSCPTHQQKMQGKRATAQHSTRPTLTTFLPVAGLAMYVSGFSSYTCKQKHPASITFRRRPRLVVHRSFLVLPCHARLCLWGH
jgi:hypothetical protein